MRAHRHVFAGQTLAHDHDHDAPRGYFGHDEDPPPHEPSQETGTYRGPDDVGEGTIP